MKKIFFVGFAVIVIMTIAAFNVNLNNSKDSLLTLANIEALAEENNGKNKGEPSERTETRTIKVQKSNTPGWSWSISSNIWLFNGSITNKAPSDAYEETQTITDKYTCCLSGYNKVCDHIICSNY